MILTQTQGSFELLTNETAIALIQKLELLDKDATLTCRKIGAGTFNYVFHVADNATNKGVIIKQAVPYAKVLGESWPLTLKRAAIEADALLTFGSYCPEYVPKVYYADKQLAITVMEDLSHVKIARTGLIEGESYPLISQHIGEYAAKTLFYTSDYYLEPSTKKEIARAFTNPELCKIIESSIFTGPFFEHTPTDYEVELSEIVETLWNDHELKLEVAKLKKIFMSEQEALLHGDLHTGHILASESETKVIAPEFAFYGPIGFDTGQFISNLLFQAVTREEAHQGIILSHIQTFWSTFTDIYSTLWSNESRDAFKNIDGLLSYVLQKAKADSFGFAGWELIRRASDLSPVIDLNGIANTDQRINVKTNALTLGTHLVKNRSTLDIPTVIELVKQVTCSSYSTL
ncbi:S-methyl-5-thioribose kinase [Peribacillus asahii]|nr:S-methyl-5-thioribose kinase [Peribacillus asahii]USK72493.1 S-methyl-5-thioribose kinase [Peribacillus asahii]